MIFVRKYQTKLHIMDLPYLIYLLNFGKYNITIQMNGDGRYINKVSILGFIYLKIYKYDVSEVIIRIKLYKNIIVITLSY